MEVSNVAPGDGGAPVSVDTTAPVTAPAHESVSNNPPISPREAAQALAARRVEKRKEQQAAPAESGEPPQESTAQAEDAAPPQEAPGETQEAEPAAQPPIEPPRSWTKEEKERFASLPRETQDYLAHREQDRERAVRQSQNEAAEQRKAYDAERQKVEAARQHYEAALPQLLATLQQQQAGEFADVRTIQDVENLARNDWPRYLQWDLAQKKVAAVQQQVTEATQRQYQEQWQKFAEYAEREDKLVSEKIPELSDPTQRSKIQQAAISYLRDAGFGDKELSAAWNGQAGLSLRDHRLQSLIRDGVKYREIQEQKKTVAAKPLPPVARPGVAASRSAVTEANIRDLSTKLERTGNLRDAAALVAARRAAKR